MGNGALELFYAFDGGVPGWAAWRERFHALACHQELILEGGRLRVGMKHCGILASVAG